MYTLDTNTILYYLKDDPDTVSFLGVIFAQNVPLYVSAITELELFAFSNLNAEEETLIEELLTTLAIIPVDSHVARLAAFVRRQYRLKVPDSAIAATAMFTGSTLLTRNTRDFRRVTGLSVRKVRAVTGGIAEGEVIPEKFRCRRYQTPGTTTIGIRAVTFPSGRSVRMEGRWIGRRCFT